uniref:Uncharacterized protein n=1 Tax=Cacopsylla melanoneura TaxID=428564 RepID=A0A8D9BG88_9HEMI
MIALSLYFTLLRARGFLVFLSERYSDIINNREKNLIPHFTAIPSPSIPLLSLLARPFLGSCPFLFRLSLLIPLSLSPGFVLMFLPSFVVFSLSLPPSPSQPLSPTSPFGLFIPSPYII